MTAETSLRPELSWAASPVDPGRLGDYYREVESFQRERVRSARRSARIAWGFAGISLATNLALGFAVASMLPLERLVPLYLWVRHDGTIDSFSEISDLPATQAEGVIRAAVWQYVRERESYAYADAQYRYDVVSLMSAAYVRDAYQRWFLSSNPESPQNTIGKRGQIDTAIIGLSFVRPQVALVRYYKTTLTYGGAPQKTTWTATVGFERVEKLPASARLSDPGGIIVTSYQNSQDSPQ